MNNIGERISKLIDNKQYADAISISEGISPFVGFSEQIRHISYRRDNLAVDWAYNTINDSQYEAFHTKLMGELKSLFKNFPDNVVPHAVSSVLLDMFPVKTLTPVNEEKTTSNTGLTIELFEAHAKNYQETVRDATELFHVLDDEWLNIFLKQYERQNGKQKPDWFKYIPWDAGEQAIKTFLFSTYRGIPLLCLELQTNFGEETIKVEIDQEVIDMYNKLKTDKQ